MASLMCAERDAHLFATDERFCIDNGTNYLLSVNLIFYQ